MLGNIQPNRFLFQSNSHAKCQLQNVEDNEREDEGEGTNRQRADQLGRDVMCRIKGEDANSNRPPDSTDSVDRDAPTGSSILILSKTRIARTHQDTRDRSNDDRCSFADRIGTCGDTNQSSQNSIQRHGNIRLLNHKPGGKDR